MARESGKSVTDSETPFAGICGDAATQRVVDTLVNQASDALGALTDAFADTSRALQAVASRQRHELGG